MARRCYNFRYKPSTRIGDCIMKIKFGAIVTDGRGKIGGHVASKNRAGAYIRTKVTPVNPQTSAQALARNRLAGISEAWRGLTQAQRNAWNAAVGDYARTDIFGDLKSPSGFNLYQQLNNNLILAGEAGLTSPPAVEAVDALTSLSIVAEDATVAESLTLTFAPAIAADHQIKIFATAPQSAGKNFVKSEYRLILMADNGDSSPLDVITEYQAVFGSTGDVGQKVFVKMVPVNTNTGQEGTAISASTLVVASS